MKDLELDETGDLKITNGDFVIKESDQQHVLDIFSSFPGEFKEYPLVGFGATKYLKGNFTENDVKRALKLQLENDGFENPIIDLSEGYDKLKISI